MLAIRLPRPYDAEPVTELAEKKPREPEAVVMWRCPECQELYDDDYDAEQCCADEDDLSSLADARCPSCGTGYETFESAVDCCMWLTHCPAERWEMARQLKTYGYLLESALANAVVEQDGGLL